MTIRHNRRESKGNESESADAPYFAWRQHREKIKENRLDGSNLKNKRMNDILFLLLLLYSITTRHLDFIV